MTTKQPRRPGHPRILFAEDDSEMRELVASRLRRAGYDVVECCDGASLVRRLGSTFLPNVSRDDFDLVISDIRMPGFTGLEVLDGLHDRPGFPAMILITAFGDPETHEQASQLGAIATLDKPFRIPELLQIVHCFIKQRCGSSQSDHRGLPNGKAIPTDQG